LRLDERLGGLKQLLLTPLGIPPQQKAVFLGDELSQVADQTDQPPTTVKPGTGPLVPSDVNTNVPIYIEQKLADGRITYVARPRTYSANAFKFDLSSAIRLDALWQEPGKVLRQIPCWEPDIQL